MPRKIDTLASAPLVHKLTPRPKPQTFRIAEPIDDMEWRLMLRAGMSRQEAIDRLRRHMIRLLAEHLVENAQAFQFDFDRVLREKRLCIEVTIDDRGTYEHMVDDAERAGRCQGIREAIAAMPYGMNETYE